MNPHRPPRIIALIALCSVLSPRRRPHATPARRRDPDLALLLTLLLAPLLFTLVGCAGTPAPLPDVPVQRVGGWTTGAVVGDWNDVEPAVRVGVEQGEAAIERITPTADATTLTFDLRTHLDEDARVRVTRELGGHANGERITLRIACRIEPFGDAAREERFIELIARRLTQLTGVEFAPIE